MKLISIILVFGLTTGQIGCGSKVVEISAPLDQVKFEKDYKYAVQLKTGKRTEIITGDQLQGKSDQLIIKNKSDETSIMNYEVEFINGVSTKRNGSHVFEGLCIGAITGSTFGSLIGFAFVNDFCPDGGCGDRSAGAYFKGAVIFGAMFGAIGGVLGLGTGALIPKHDKIQITPIVAPTTSGVNAGANLQMTF